MFKHALMLYLPLIFSNVIHMLVVRYNWLPELKIPLNAKLFGANKTHRGFVITPMLNGLFYFLISSLLFGKGEFNLGIVLGLTYMLFELPNSYLKRKMGIQAGQTATGKSKWLIHIMDKSDSALGVSLVYASVKGLGTEGFLILFLGAFLVHSFFSLILVKIRMKESY